MGFINSDSVIALQELKRQKWKTEGQSACNGRAVYIKENLKSQGYLQNVNPQGFCSTF